MVALVEPWNTAPIPHLLPLKEFYPDGGGRQMP